ncbi:MAG: hypothetical protein F4Y86_13575 [Gammaproteobacteria bacterium]|nr:hypothetical protein [Gammaproteobacteria bacterium]MYB36288.1 hypothetical protein [Gammaproteobacteria bacterium]
MQGTRFTSEEIAACITRSGDTCLLIAPGVDAIVAQALCKRARRAQKPKKARVIIDGSHHAERSGYGETATWRELMCETDLRALPGTRMGLLVTDHAAWLFAPRAGKLDGREEGGLSAVLLEADVAPARELFERISGQAGGEKQREDGATTEAPAFQVLQPESDDGGPEPRANAEALTSDDVEKAEDAIRQHPPRDYAQEREVTVYTSFVGYIELRLVGAQLGKEVRLKIPNQLVERGLGEDEMRKRINENVRIRLDEDVDTGVREVDERLKAIRALYTRQLGEPHGRIYRKRQRPELERHFKDLRLEIERANMALGSTFEAAVKTQLDGLAATYATQSVADDHLLNEEDIRRLLKSAWHEAGASRPREVKLEVTFKDLTWQTLQDRGLRRRIVEQFPDLQGTTLYREYQAHTPSS